MADQEKVIKGLEKAVEVFDGRIYGPMFEMWMDETKDAIALLKAQEPVEPQEKREGDYKNLYCGACGCGIVGYVGHLTGKHFKVSDYCCKCGQAVKWE